MLLLCLGLGLWCAVHLTPAAAPDVRMRLIGNLGEITYKLLFSILLILSIVLMVDGWRSIQPGLVVAPPAVARPVAMVVVLIAVILLFAPYVQTNIKRVLRHPQLTGVVLWSIAHLFANGEVRSIILFGVLGLWAIGEMILINRREGVWTKPNPVPVAKDIQTAVAGTAAYSILLFAHPYLSGVALISAP
ncbi:MAG: NnrU family protein [Gammaproteobacteria bacterium]|nr:NnrU family protein [Gammaproteobacteria bacterium]